MAAPKLALVLISVLGCLMVYRARAVQQCAPLRGTILQACTAAGYNTTYPIPKDIKLSDRSKRWIRFFTSYGIRSMKNCSVAQMGEAILCSFYAPYCRPQDSAPFLPCRRVCSEFLKRCEGTIDYFWLEYYVGACSLLLNATAASRKCYEPPGFYKYHNSSTKGLLEGGCNPLQFPMCKGRVGYNYTSMTIPTQLRLYRIFYGKNFTNTSEDAIVPSGSIVAYWENYFANFSKCSSNLRKLWCGDLFPPCFPEEGFASYTLCQGFCYQIALQCPDIMDSEYGRYVTSCEVLAYGNTSHGFCKHTTWPPPMRWLKWFKDTSTSAPPTSQPTPAVKVYVIVIAVIVPIILIALIILAVMAWRQHKLPTMCLRGQDKEDLVNE